MKLLTTDKRGERMELHGTLPLSDTTYDMKVMLYSGMDFRTWMDVCVAPEYYFRCNGRCSWSTCSHPGCVAQYQCVVTVACMDGSEYAGEVCSDAKAAERSAAEQVLLANQDIVEATLQGTGAAKRKSGSALSPAEKRARAEDPDGAENPAITPKTQLNSLVMRIIKRYLQKGETVYDTKKVQGSFQSTLTLSALPGEWGERAWAGHLCSSKQKAEQSAADEALKDLQQDEEMMAEASKPKGGGKGKGKGKGKFPPASGGWEMGFFDHVMLGAWGWSPMSKGKGKGFAAPVERRVPGRDRVTDAPCVGTVVEWAGEHGWLEAALPIDHPMANSRGGK
ncbi:unnamed protein product, partial [Symbiodinium sp. KB8]